MFSREKKEKIAKNNQQLNIKIALIYLLLVLLFISLLLFL